MPCARGFGAWGPLMAWGMQVLNPLGGFVPNWALALEGVEGGTIPMGTLQAEGPGWELQGGQDCGSWHSPGHQGWEESEAGQVAQALTALPLLCCWDGASCVVRKHDTQ